MIIAGLFIDKPIITYNWLAVMGYLHKNDYFHAKMHMNIIVKIICSAY